jgi:hypothetical protein
MDECERDQDTEKKDRRESKNQVTIGSMGGVWKRRFRSIWEERVQRKKNNGEI